MSEDELDHYGDTGITSGHAKVPRWLIVTYILMPIWGMAIFFLYWNGSHGWLDRGYWNALQKAANTTFPQITEEKVEFGKEIRPSKSKEF